ncbi:hypothetical protein Gotur_004367 [Gossypium turneri]
MEPKHTYRDQNHNLENNYLSTLCNLQIRKLTTQPLCPVCRVDTKSVEHLARDRSFIKQFYIVQVFNCRLVVIVFYRNNPYHEGVQHSVQGIVTFVKIYIGEINALDTPSKPMTVMREDRWVPLTRESVKVNSDTAFLKDIYKYVYGILIRNKEGLIMAACTRLNNHVANSFMAEARVCEQVVSFAVDLGFKNVIVEGDSLPIIKKLQSSMDENLIVSDIVKEIKAKNN